MSYSNGVTRMKEQVFGDRGYSSDMHLDPYELAIFQTHIYQQWIDVLGSKYPALREKGESLGIVYYHYFSDRIDHSSLWPKKNRLLPPHAVAEIKSLSFMQRLREEFGDFSLSDIYDTHQHHGEEEIYWRLVRPRQQGDVGSLHRDCWFHEAFNNGKGMFPKGTTTIKVWIPIYCEPGKSGLAIVAGSHLRTWRYHVEMVGGNPKPILDEDISQIEAKLIPTEPGNLLIFNENVLHGGALNRGEKTRVSAEITLVLREPL